jgi:alginate O-acetyltransferase complex protein AlgI
MVVMVFSSAVFLFLFLPVLLALHFILPQRWRNLLLLAASLLFYIWGEKDYVAVLLASVALNYGLGLWLGRLEGERGRRRVIALAVALNLGLLGVFKYAAFLAGNLNALLAVLRLPAVPSPEVHLPLGISFFTFHALSYVIDVYRREVPPLKGLTDFALYISFFPQSIAGPIVRYSSVAGQLARRTITEASFAAGCRLFIIGLAKKMLLANTLGVAADGVFGLRAESLTFGVAWLGALCYTLQIYFDFSGYSDMAIGLARLFGLEFPANFNYPYIARSVTDFWRRWHMSLSTWFRDYLYIPLGGNRQGKVRTYFNLLAVFFLCGLWHGASWTFVFWGLFHGAFLVIERMLAARKGGGWWVAGVGKRKTALSPSTRTTPILSHAYTLAVVMVGWVFFRANTFAQALAFLRAMVGLGSGTGLDYAVSTFLQTDVLLALVAGLACSAPLLPWLAGLRPGARLAEAGRPRLADAVEAALTLGTVAGLALLLLGSAVQLAANTYNPFIYFRF